MFKRKRDQRIDLIPHDEKTKARVRQEQERLKLQLRALEAEVRAYER